MTRADKNVIDRTVTAAMPIWSCKLYQVARTQPRYDIIDTRYEMVASIIFPHTCLLALTQDGLKVALKLVLFVLCPVQVLIDNPLQAPGPYPIPIVFDSIYDLVALPVHEQGRHRPPRVVHWVRSGL
jgi:hypothetical protein